MIIDFNFPSPMPDGWHVDVHKVTKNNKIFVQRMRFENKDDAFEYYDHVRKMWQNQRSR